MCKKDNSLILIQLGGEAGCKRLAKDFYARVAKSKELKPLFPGKSVRCATEEFSAFLIQFLEGDETQTQYRWWLSLRESHARFEISATQRATWLALMGETIDSLFEDSEIRKALKQFFHSTSAYVIGNGEADVKHPELAKSWTNQRALDRLVTTISEGRDTEAIALAGQFSWRPSVMVGICARMIETNRESLIKFVTEIIQSESEITKSRFNGRTLLHFAASSSCLSVVHKLLDAGVDPNVLDNGGHSPLYRAASSNRSPESATVIRALVGAGACVNEAGGVARSTALHQAARFGNVGAAKALIELGANVKAKDSRGVTPLDRAINCRRHEVAALLRS